MADIVELDVTPAELRAILESLEFVHSVSEERALTRSNWARSRRILAERNQHGRAAHIRAAGQWEQEATRYADRARLALDMQRVLIPVVRALDAESQLESKVNHGE